MTTTTDSTAKAEAATLAGVTTPPGDAKAQEREAKRQALAAKKADIAAKAAAAQAKATSGTKAAATAPKATAPKQGAVGAAPAAPSPTPAPAKPTLKARLEALLSEARTLTAMRSGLQAIVDDMAKPPARGGNGGGSAAAAELEAAMLKAMAKATEAAPITLQDVMRALGCDMKDAKPYNAMKRLVADGRVTVAKTTAPKAYFVTATSK